jgi:6,7-dimethyl-8-ribityllumazine synthase
MKKSKKPRIGIVASLFNREYVDGLLERALKILEKHDLNIYVRRVPGSYEIPLAVQQMIREKKAEIVIAFGVIWQGKTKHADLVANVVTDSLMQIMLQESTPVIHQVLTVSDERQARERCFGTKLNRGREAAEAVVSFINGEWGYVKTSGG